MFLLLILTFLGCGNDVLFDREAFEGVWWEFVRYPLCFNIHDSGELLIYEHSITTAGPWEFIEPNTYTTADYSFEATATEGGCWDIILHNPRMTSLACSCVLRD